MMRTLILSHSETIAILYYYKIHAGGYWNQE